MKKNIKKTPTKKTIIAKYFIKFLLNFILYIIYYILYICTGVPVKNNQSASRLECKFGVLGTLDK